MVRPIFESVVGLFDHGNLPERFLALAMPRMVMYGQEQQPFLARSAVDNSSPTTRAPPVDTSASMEAQRRIVSLGACLVPSRSGALHDAEDGASLCPASWVRRQWSSLNASLLA